MSELYSECCNAPVDSHMKCTECEQYCSVYIFEVKSKAIPLQNELKSKAIT